MDIISLMLAIWLIAPLIWAFVEEHPLWQFVTITGIVIFITIFIWVTFWITPISTTEEIVTNKVGDFKFDYPVKVVETTTRYPLRARTDEHSYTIITGCTDGKVPKR